MPTVEEWLAVLDPEYHATTRYFFELAPEWLATGSLEEGLLCRFESPTPGVEPLVIRSERPTYEWGAWHGEYFCAEGWPSRNIAMRNHLRMKLILRGEVVRLEGFARNGRRILVTLANLGEDFRQAAEHTRERPLHRVVTTHWQDGKAIH